VLRAFDYSHNKSGDEQFDTDYEFDRIPINMKTDDIALVYPEVISALCDPELRRLIFELLPQPIAEELELELLPLDVNDVKEAVASEQAAYEKLFREAEKLAAEERSLAHIERKVAEVEERALAEIGRLKSHLEKLPGMIHLPPALAQYNHGDPQSISSEVKQKTEKYVTNLADMEIVPSTKMIREYLLQAKKTASIKAEEARVAADAQQPPLLHHGFVYMLPSVNDHVRRLFAWNFDDSYSSSDNW
jgi:hypothetical protein